MEPSKPRHSSFRVLLPLNVIRNVELLNPEFNLKLGSQSYRFIFENIQRSYPARTN